MFDIQYSMNINNQTRACHHRHCMQGHGGGHHENYDDVFQDTGIPDPSAVAKRMEVSEKDIAHYGKRGLKTEKITDMKDMLYWALLDEYVARDTYDQTVEKFGAEEAWVFDNLRQAEQRHINHLVPLFQNHGIDIPDIDTTDKIELPSSLQNAYAACVQGEIENISMYTVFMNDVVLPDDVKWVFGKLMSASFRHLNATRKGLASTKVEEGSSLD